jgi:PAS domain S-box-containing protein
MQDYQLRQREHLLQISRAMTSKLDLPSVLRLILENAVEMLRGHGGLIALRQNDDSFHVRASYGLPGRLLPLFSPLLDDIPHLTGQAHLSRWQIPDLQLKLGMVAAAAGMALRQVVALPLVIEEELIGVIYVFRTSGAAFSANDRQVLSSFADQAAIAVRNASLYQQVSAEKRRLDAIIENSADGVMILDCQGRITVFNRALAAMTGWRPEDAMGRPCHEVLQLRDRRGEDICKSDCPLRGLSPDADLYVEGDIERAGGAPVSVGVTYSPLYDEEDRLINIIANVYDITRFREAEEIKSTFISVISHELKTPVSIIKGYSGTLRREDARWDEETVREGLTIIEEESDRLDRLISNLLDASRAQAGSLKLEMDDVHIPKLAQRVVEGFRLQTDVHVSNAIKYSPGGGKIRLGGYADRDKVTVYVADEGIGIPLDEQPRLFQRFYRLDSSLRRRTQGMGLGLYLCQAIVEAHRGRIWVESAPGQGSRFYFTLPRQ